nr:cytochrome P450 [Sphingomonas sp. TREG-RG-20F-R18-01]
MDIEDTAENVPSAELLDPSHYPGPETVPVLGNLHQIPRGGFTGHILELSREFADPGIFKVMLGKRALLFATDPDLVAELCDETRFRKLPGQGLRIVRRFAGDGLFTAFTEEENWGKAHRILLPAFSQRAMRGYFGMILEVCDQLVTKWTKAEGQDVLVADDMTRLTLDSIAIAGFGHRFGSFERDELDPFLEALARVLAETRKIATRLPIKQRFAKKANANFEADIAEMNALVDGLIAERRRTPAESRDLLNLMLTATDPETGAPLDDLNIRYQVLTFLIAGHDTTSGLLTFALMELLRSPAVLAQAYVEVDRVLPGDTRPTFEHLAHLKVIERVIKEAQRLWPTAPSFSVGAYEDTVIGGKWVLPKDRPISVFALGLHRHPRAWPDPEEFDVDRWLPEAEAQHHPHSYKPFGNGARACIGRQFALVEAKLALAMILQRFAIADKQGYRLKLMETLTIKPDAFRMRIKARAPHDRLIGGELFSTTRGAEEVLRAAGDGRRLSVLYGTSLGTARDVAEEIAERASNDGFEARALSLDEAMGTLPEDRVIVVVTATYNGRAPDSALAVEAAIDATRFAQTRWPETRFAVLGIGNSQWPNYQAFPKKIDAAFAATGAQRLCPRGEANGDGDFDAGVSAFLKELWEALGATGGQAETGGLTLALVDAREVRAVALPEHAIELEVKRNDELVRPADGLWNFADEAPRGSTRFMTLALPDGQTYAAGDHLAIYARNRNELVNHALERLGTPAEMLVIPTASGARFRHLPVGRTVTVRQLLADFVDLSEAMSRRALDAVTVQTRCPNTRRELVALVEDEAWRTQVAEPRLTLLGLLLRHPAAELSLDSFVEVSPAIAPRFYSIASSPIVNPHTVDLIVGTVHAPAWSGVGMHQGLASTHLRHLEPGARAFGYVRRPNPPFAPPRDGAVPLVLIGPGTGFAPLRGFLQGRAALGATSSCHLFFGARHPNHDWFCREEMEAWAGDGVVELHLAFSQVPEQPHLYVQDALWAARNAIWTALSQGGQIFLCGDGRFMAPAVRDTLIRIHADKTGGDHLAGSKWLEAMVEDGIYHQDVFGFGK